MDGNDNDGEWSTGDLLRWIAALFVAIGAGVWYFEALRDQSICQGQIPDGALRAAQVCGPPRLLDLVPFGLVIGLLLWPDLGELAVTGLVTLRRRVLRQENRQDATDGRLDGLDQRITQLSVLRQDQGQEQVLNFYAYPADQDDLRRNIGAKEAGEAKVDGMRSPATDPPPEAIEAKLLEEAGERQCLVGEFIREYSRLEPYLQRPGSRLAGQIEAELTPETLQQVRLWHQLFEPEIAALRQTRNAIVHHPEPVSTDTIRGAVENTRELSRILFDRIA